MNDASGNPIFQIDVEKRVEQYVKLRDKKAELVDKHKEELAPFNALMEAIEAEFTQVLNQSNVDNMKTGAGTVSISMKSNVSTADMNAFWTWIVTQGAFDMLDKKPNVTAITEYVKANGIAPPGVNYSTFQKIGVRRK
jgi:hypothetical protein